jgi:hypothetical protein
MAIMKYQKAAFKVLENKKKDNTLTVEWLNTCGLTSRAFQACTYDGTEASSNTQDYTLDLHREVVIKLKESTFYANDFDKEEALKFLIMQADKQLVEYVAQQVVTVIEANKGVNEFTTGKGSVSGTETYINAAYWDAQLMAYMAKVGIINKFNQPFILDGGNLFEKVWTAEKTKAVEDGLEQSLLFGAYPYEHDLVNIDAVAGSTKTYLMNQGSIAVISKAYEEVGKVRVFKDEDRTAINSVLVPGFTYDMHMINACDGDHHTDQAKIIFKGAVIVNPTGCTATNTNILSFSCGAVPQA